MGMSTSEGLKFATDFDIVPDIANRKQFAELWKAVNASEAADDDAEQCDSEEFTELLVRLAAYYAPGVIDLEHGHGLAKAFGVLLTFMSNSKGGKARGMHFKIS